jgi:outer membrane protein assembly factor BamB
MTYGGELYALDKEAGTIVWKAKDVGGVAHMLLAGDHLYVSTVNGKLYVIRAHDGVAEFVYNNQKEGEIYTGPVRIQDFIIIGGSRTGVYAFTHDLQLVDTYRVGSGILGELATDGDTVVYFTSNYANVYSLKVP